MGNPSVSGAKPLISPQDLWGKPPAPPVQNPVPTSLAPPPTSLPPLPSQPLAPAVAPASPPQGTSLPVLPFTQPPKIQDKTQQFSALLKNADQTLLSHVTQNQVQLLKNDQGQITGYTLNGRPVSQQDIQNHLLPMSGHLHQQLKGLQAVMHETYSDLVKEAQQVFPQLAPQEQVAVNIQFQAVQVLYESFTNRINHVDALIK